MSHPQCTVYGKFHFIYSFIHFIFGMNVAASVAVASEGDTTGEEQNSADRSID